MTYDLPTHLHGVVEPVVNTGPVPRHPQEWPTGLSQRIEESIIQGIAARFKHYPASLDRRHWSGMRSLYYLVARTERANHIADVDQLYKLMSKPYYPVQMPDGSLDNGNWQVPERRDFDRIVMAWADAHGVRSWQKGHTTALNPGASRTVSLIDGFSIRQDVLPEKDVLARLGEIADKGIDS